jgi:hypothetical protein
MLGAWRQDLAVRVSHCKQEIAVQLVEALAEHVNDGRADDQVAVPPPGKSTVKYWVRQEAKLRENHTRKQPAFRSNVPVLPAILIWRNP